MYFILKELHYSQFMEYQIAQMARTSPLPFVIHRNSYISKDHGIQLTKLIELTDGTSNDDALMPSCLRAAAEYAEKHKPVDTTTLLRTKLLQLQLLTYQMLQLRTHIECTEAELTREIDALSDPDLVEI